MKTGIFFAIHRKSRISLRFLSLPLLFVGIKVADLRNNCLEQKNIMYFRMYCPENRKSRMRARQTTNWISFHLQVNAEQQLQQQQQHD